MLDAACDTLARRSRCSGPADVVFDLFHVVKAFNKVIDNIRNEELRNAGTDLRELLKGVCEKREAVSRQLSAISQNVKRL